MHFHFIIALSLISFTGLSQASTIFTDPRDLQQYPIVKIEGKEWFASNLNWESPQSECFEDDSIACGDWGRVYPIAEMRNVCPTGWRTPNLSDWKGLQTVMDSLGVDALYDGTRWINNEQAGNETGLSLVPSGFKDKRKFLHQYYNCTIWFDIENEEGSNWHFHTDGNNNESPYYFHTHGNESEYRKFAVRCVRDGV
ncbi:MAG: hypothetical protein JNM00_02330 [Flavobacteriales bacterium]|nr:hypothetical protein [Flavobacteriales bacterium]